MTMTNDCYLADVTVTVTVVSFFGSRNNPTIKPLNNQTADRNFGNSVFGLLRIAAVSLISLFALLASTDSATTFIFPHEL